MATNNVWAPVICLFVTNSAMFGRFQVACIQLAQPGLMPSPIIAIFTTAAAYFESAACDKAQACLHLPGSA